MSSIETQELSGTLNNTNSLRGTLNGDNNLQGTLSNARNSGSGGGGNTLVISLPPSLIEEFSSEEGVFVSPQSTGDKLKFYNNINEVVESDKLKESSVIFSVVTDAILTSSPMSIKKYNSAMANGISGFAVLGENGMDNTKLDVIRIETITENGVKGYVCVSTTHPFSN